MKKGELLYLALGWASLTTIGLLIGFSIVKKLGELEKTCSPCECNQ